MPTSDSEDFESADEGHGSPTKRDRNKRLSSSNYSDNLESDLDVKKAAATSQIQTDTPKNVEPTTTDGWDDFDLDDSDPVPNPVPSKPSVKPIEQSSNEPKEPKTTSNVKSKDTGWDDFDDWGDGVLTAVRKEPKSSQSQPEQDIKEVTKRLAQTTTKSEGWGWGWGVDSLLSTATAGITTLTNQVSQGFTTVLESGIGAPDPAELARRTTKETEATKPSKSEESQPTEEVKPEAASGGNDAFPFGSLLSGVTKFVETTGTKVLAGGLDTLETIGKKTMEVLQDGDPGLAKKRAMLGLDSGDKPVLSQVLREAKARADEEDKVREAKREAKEVHYENLFDDFEGLVHLEALEMLSKQVNMRIEERLRSVDSAKRQEIKETLQQVAELCEMPEEDEDEEDDDEDQPAENSSKPDALHERLQKATRDIGLKIQFLPLIKQYKDILEWLESSEENQSEKMIYKRAVAGLAQATALSVELYHKSAEMLLVKPRRSTADEADALTQMTVVLTKHISELATIFTEKLNTHPAEDKEQINNYITNVFLEAGNSSKYIENAFQLALPILQIGAV